MLTKEFLLLILMSSLQIKAQQWPVPGAEWIYCEAGFNEFDGYWQHQMSYTGDTVINTSLYQVTESTNSVYITRYSNDTVYRWVNNQEYLFFHFQMHLGEVISTYRSKWGGDDSLCTSVLNLLVIDSGTVIIEGEPLTRWKLRDTALYNTGIQEYSDYWIYERIGFISGFWFWSQYDWAACESLILEGWSSEIGQYSDQNFTHHWNTCAVSVIDQSATIQLRIFPNPTTSLIQTELPFQSYFITSSDGRMVQQGPNSGNCINVESLNAGVYFITFQMENDLHGHAVFMKE